MILVTAMAALVLTSVVVLVVYKTRNQQGHGIGEMIRDQAEEDAVTSRDQLNEMRDQADKLTAAGQPPGMPRFAG